MLAGVVDAAADAGDRGRRPCECHQVGDPARARARPPGAGAAARRARCRAPEDVELDHPPPLLERRVLDRTEQHHAGVVDHRVEPPELARPSSTAPLGLLPSVTSASSDQRLPAVPLRSARRARSSRSARRAATTTAAPARPGPRAVASPMPLLAPVTSATVPERGVVMGLIPAPAPPVVQPGRSGHPRPPLPPGTMESTARERSKDAGTAGGRLVGTAGRGGRLRGPCCLVRPELAGAAPCAVPLGPRRLQSNVALAAAKRAKVRPADPRARWPRRSTTAPSGTGSDLADARFLRPRVSQHHRHRRGPGREASLGCAWPTSAWASTCRSRAPASWSTTPRPTSPRRCTSATCAARSSATRSPACSSYLGHTVIRQNHLGDWGTPFGMLIEHLLDIGEDGTRRDELVRRRPDASTRPPGAKFDGDPAFADRARAAGRRAAGRRSGDARALAATSSTQSTRTSTRVYDAARRHADRADVAGESLYNPTAREVVAELEAAGPRARQRGRALRLPAGLHRPGRRAAAADRPQAGRRLRLRGHRPGRAPPPRQRRCRPTAALRRRRAAGAALRAWSSRPPGWPAGSRRPASRPSTSRSASVLGADGSRSRPGPASPSG